MLKNYEILSKENERARATGKEREQKTRNFQLFCIYILQDKNFN